MKEKVTYLGIDFVANSNVPPTQAFMIVENQDGISCVKIKNIGKWRWLNLFIWKIKSLWYKLRGRYFSDLQN